MGTKYTLTGDLAAQVGDHRYLDHGYIVTNLPAGVPLIDKTATSDGINIGTVPVVVSETGLFSVSLLGTANTGLNVAANTLRYRMFLTYVDKGDKQRKTFDSGWFALTANSALKDLMDTVDAIEAATSLTARVEALEAGGDVAALAAQVNGYTNLGNVSGAVTIQPVGTQRLVATAATTISIASGHADGESFTLLVRGGGDYISWASSIGFDHGAPEGDKISVTFLKVDGYWTDLSGATTGGGEVTPVTDPPTQPGTVTVDPTSDGYNLSWVASTVAAGYEVQLDGGSWVDSGSNLTHTFTSLSPGSEHSGAVRAYNSTGARSTARAWGPASVDIPALHDLILSMEPEVYVRMTEGAIQDYSRVSAPWTAYSEYGGPGMVPTDFTGPPLTPADTGSLVPAANTRVERPSSGLMVGATEMTQMTISGMKPDGVAGDGKGTPIMYGDVSGLPSGQTGVESYDAHKPGGVHTWFSVWNPAVFGDNNVRRYIDGNTGEHSITGGPGAPPFPAIGSPAKLFMGGNAYGGSTMGGYSAYTVIFNRALTHDERVALATAAGTLGNPAGGTLT